MTTANGRNWTADASLFVGNFASWLALISAVWLDQFRLFGGYDVIRGGITAMLIVLALLATIANFKRSFSKGPLRCKDDTAINTEMRRIIEMSGNTCVLTRNVSWANDDSVMSALASKASSGDLKLFSQVETKCTSDLALAGGDVRLYGPTGFTPQCRFTIKRHMTKDAEVFIAHVNAGSHEIYKYTASDGPILHLACDLINLLEIKCVK